jgi:hypothetical protein
MMDQFHDTAAALMELTESLKLDEPRDVLLERMARKVSGLLPEADGVTVTLYVNDVPSTVAATDDALIPLDKAQYSANEGPCLLAGESETIVRTHLPEAVSRWPEFGQMALTLGIRTSLSCPLFVPADGPAARRRVSESLSGALNVWSHRANAFDPVEAALIAMFTSAMSAIVLTASRWATAERQAETLLEALGTRDTIATAKGIVMAQLCLNPEEAFHWLTDVSQRTNRKLRDIAELIVADHKVVKSGL